MTTFNMVKRLAIVASVGLEVLAMSVSPALAQQQPRLGTQIHQPGPLRSDMAAVLQYEAGQLRTLQERCRREDAQDWENWEQGRMVSGWAVQTRKQAKAGQNAAYARVDLDKRLAYWVDHQGLDGSQRLYLKLALPRDYARCRIVTGKEGQLRLEVIHQSTLVDGRARALFAQMGSVQGNTTCSYRDSALVVFRAGEGAAWPLCTDAQKLVALQARQLTFELLGEDPQMR